MYCECGCGQQTTVGDHVDRKYGYAKGEPRRFIRGHRAKLYQPVRTYREAWDRIIEPRLSKQFGCWVNTSGTKDARGYYSVLLGGAGGKRVKAHRIAYTLFNGPIPDGLFVMHLCDNPSCCNPDHLRAGTCAENQTDMANKGRACRGEQRSHVLTDDDVRQIRAEWRLDHSWGRGKALAAQYGISAQALSGIIHGRAWKHVL